MLKAIRVPAQIEFTTGNYSDINLTALMDNSLISLPAGNLATFDYIGQGIIKTIGGAIADVTSLLGQNILNKCIYNTINASNAAYYHNVNADVLAIIDLFGAYVNHYDIPNNSYGGTIKINGSTITPITNPFGTYSENAVNCGTGFRSEFGCGFTSGIYPVNYTACVLPEDFYDGTKFNTPTLDGRTIVVSFSVRKTQENVYVVDRVVVNVGIYSKTTVSSFVTAMTNVDTSGILESDDPYEFIGGGNSGTGGGDGSGLGEIDSIEKAEIPQLPSLSAVNAGFITIYNPTSTQIHSLAAYLWSNDFDIDNFKKLFSNPMDAIIGLGIIPIQPSLGGSKAVKFGSVTTNVTMPYLSSQWAEKDMGSINVKKYVGSFMDYSPYVKVSLYLPYIGFKDISADDCMSDSIRVVYHVDCLTGGCTAYVYIGNKGIMYQFSGSCIANVPLTALNFSGAIQNAVSGALNIGVTAIGAATGSAPLAIGGAGNLIKNAANTALNTKEGIQRSGSMGGASGLMSYQKPYIVIQRPRISIPQNLNKFAGNTLNMTKKLDSVSGFTVIDHIILDGIPATENEKEELNNILSEGVIF